VVLTEEDQEDEIGLQPE